MWANARRPKWQIKEQSHMLARLRALQNKAESSGDTTFLRAKIITLSEELEKERNRNKREEERRKRDK